MKKVKITRVTKPEIRKILSFLKSFELKWVIFINLNSTILMIVVPAIQSIRKKFFVTIKDK